MSLAITRKRTDARRVQQFIAFGVLTLVATLVVGSILALLGFIVFHGAKQINRQFLTQAPNALDASGGIFPALVGTAWLIGTTILLALPLGVIGAIYLSEYGGTGRIVRLIRAAIVNLAGVPSIVHGLFGLGFFVLFVGGAIDKFVLHTDKPVWGRPCLLWGACTLAVVILPIIIKSTEEALAAIPKSFREGSQALGAKKLTTIRRVILPAAIPEILTGAVLGIGRAAGETAPVMITCAASFKPSLPSGLSDQAMLLPYHLYFVVTQVPNTSLELKSGIALVLIGFVAVTTLSVVVYRAKVKRSRKW